MEWEPEAERELEKIPEHVRSMAKMGVETSVEKKGKTLVTHKDVKEAEEQFRALMEKDDKTTKIAVVRCDIVSEVCPGVACFKAFNKRKVHFSEYGKDTEIIGFSPAEDARAGVFTGLWTAFSSTAWTLFT